MKFSELSDDAKQKARENYSINYSINEFINEDIEIIFKEKLDDAGLPHNNVYFSLGHCQGDFVSFEGFIDLIGYLQKNKIFTEYKRLFDCGGNERVSFEVRHPALKSMTLNMDDFISDYHAGTEEQIKQVRWLAEELYDYIKDHISSTSKKLRYMGYEIIEDLESDQSIECSGIEFNEDGTIAW